MRVGPPVIASEGARSADAVSFDGIPARPLASYVNAERLLARDIPACGLRWQLLAAIARVESHHGFFGRSQVDADGVSRPSIIGIPLDGRPGIALIVDSDNGAMDRDTVYDRAVGPFQFLPVTWRALGRDGDGDGDANVHDLDDAAYGAGHFLCRGMPLTSDPGRRRAVFRYNPSRAYVDHVLSWYEVYLGLPGTPGDVPAPDTENTPAPSPSPSPSPTVAPSPSPSPSPTVAPSPSPSPSPTVAPSPSPSPTPTATPGAP